MRITLSHVQHIADHIAVDLNKSTMVTMTKGLEPVAAAAVDVLQESIKKESALDARVDEMLEEYEDQIEENLADERQLFFMIKKKMAPEFDVIMSYEDRYSDVAHKILDLLYEEDLIHFDIEEIRIKNMIYASITGYIAQENEIADAVLQKIRSYKRDLIPGTDDYEILYERLYKEELTKRGMV